MNKIKALREAKGLTQAQLSEMAEIHRVTIARYETSDVGMTTDSALRIAAALGCTVDDLLGTGGTDGNITTNPAGPVSGR